MEFTLSVGEVMMTVTSAYVPSEDLLPTTAILRYNSGQASEGVPLPTAYLPGGSKVFASYLPARVVRVKLAPIRERGHRPSLAGVYKTALLLTRPAGVIWRSYYYAGPARIAMREDSDQGSEVVTPSPPQPASPANARRGGSRFVTFGIEYKHEQAQIL